MELSIIIPHYNSVDSLKKLLFSIPKLDEIEIIVIDDKSYKDLDKLDDLIRDNNFSNVIFIKNNTGKKGAGVCRNIGLEKANGKWILFADADDFFLNDFYDIVSCYFETDNDVVFFTPTSIESDTGAISDRHKKYEQIVLNYIKNNNYENELLLRYDYQVPWSKLIRANFLKENKIYFDEVIASNDVMFSTKVGYYMKKFDVSSKVIYCVTKNKGSLTVNMSENIFKARLMVHINYYQFLKSHLSEDEFRYLDIRGTGFIIEAIKRRMGLKKVLFTYLLLKKSKVKILSFNYLNPLYTARKLLFHYRKYKENKKYFIRDE